MKVGRRIKSRLVFKKKVKHLMLRKPFRMIQHLLYFSLCSFSAAFMSTAGNVLTYVALVFIYNLYLLSGNDLVM